MKDRAKEGSIVLSEDPHIELCFKDVLDLEDELDRKTAFLKSALWIMREATLQGDFSESCGAAFLSGLERLTEEIGLIQGAAIRKLRK